MPVSTTEKRDDALGVRERVAGELELRPACADAQRDRRPPR